MKTRRPSSSTVVLSLLGGLFWFASPAYAQASTTSTFTAQASGMVGPPLNPLWPGVREDVFCSGPVKIATTVVKDPTMPPGVVVSIDTRGLSCIGQSTGTAYVNSGQANLTRPLVATDLIKTTFAFYPNAAGGFLKARTALATVILTYDTTTGALTNATAAIGNF